MRYEGIRGENNASRMSVFLLTPARVSQVITTTVLGHTGIFQDNLPEESMLHSTNYNGGLVCWEDCKYNTAKEKSLASGKSDYHPIERPEDVEGGEHNGMHGAIAQSPEMTLTLLNMGLPGAQTELHTDISVKRYAWSTLWLTKIQKVIRRHLSLDCGAGNNTSLWYSWYRLSHKI